MCGMNWILFFSSFLLFVLFLLEIMESDLHFLAAKLKSKILLPYNNIHLKRRFLSSNPQNNNQFISSENSSSSISLSSSDCDMKWNLKVDQLTIQNQNLERENSKKSLKFTQTFSLLYSSSFSSFLYFYLRWFKKEMWKVFN